MELKLSKQPESEASFLNRHIKDIAELPGPDGLGSAACNGCHLRWMVKKYGEAILTIKSSTFWPDPAIRVEKDGEMLAEFMDPNHCCQDAWRVLFQRSSP